MNTQTERRQGCGQGLHRCTQTDWRDLAVCCVWCAAWLAVFTGCVWLMANGDAVIAFRDAVLP